MSHDLCKPFYHLLLSSSPSIFFSDLHTQTKHINEENTYVFTLIPPLPLLQTKPVVTMAADSKEAKLDTWVDLTVPKGPGKQKQSEELCKRPALKVTVTKCLKISVLSL